jgi:apolipoprotein D and lipocalin family protein
MKKRRAARPGIDAALATCAAARGRLRRDSLLRYVAGVMGAVLMVVGGCAAQDRGGVQTVDAVDVDRYLGDWFEIARFPNRFQDECVGDVTASYATRADGRLDVINRCRTEGGPIDARGVARIVDTQTRARLQVRFAPAWLSFLPFVWGDYWILGLAHDYSWAVVGSPDRDYLWILARTPMLEWEDYTLALATAGANGFDVGRLSETRQSAENRP